MNKRIYLDAGYSDQERAEDLVSRMTLEEKAAQLLHQAPAIERLGVPQYNWWNEGLHGVARAGTATIFPQAIALASIFDEAYLQEIAAVIATEARAKYNESLRKGDRDIYKGLTMWAPNINIFRDPRWGRGQETYGECPYLTERLGVAYIKGLQGQGKRLKVAACAKHYAVHSGPEQGRHEFNAVVSLKDLYETYLPAFEASVKEGKVESVMGAYNAVNGVPCCGNHFLLEEILRQNWGFDGHVVSDCGAICDFHNHHKVTANAAESAAVALKNGCDINCGHTYLHLMQAYREGLIREEEITTSAVRLMRTRIRLGMFDEAGEYDNIPYEVNDCQEHRDKSLEAARKSMVLLKNNGLLPLNKSSISSIAVIGPNADSQTMLRANYFGTASKYVTILEGIQAAVEPGTRVYYSEGCHLLRSSVEEGARRNDRLSEALAMAERSDVVVLCLGLDADIEGEEGDASNPYASGDRVDLGLPGVQQELLERITAVGKPTVLILGTGSALAVNWADEHCDAILNAWYPGSLGGIAASDLLFGEYSPSGKLPITFYRSTDDLPAFTDYSMVGRTYRYMEQESLYPFGFGLTYSRTELSGLLAREEIAEGEVCEATVTITNTGAYAIEEVIQLYVKDLESAYAVTNYSLADFKRVELPVGASQTVTLRVRPASMQVVTEAGERQFDSRRFRGYIGTSQPDERSVVLSGSTPLSFEWGLV
ncbi:glycoside hydrolase family 3 C-terminal domain-containing protein [Paenibacillus agri]|uniref:Glycoside hydrolase family 3 C-terminal domain-containing protein n=1 Tax=Paenibacillus agri TaxID=2744309 RepID=A0A850EQI8_9BACL|nr:glycoside hydrolase family 3 C-terminal domain-containing protein [Paenibacillus agri]NUU63215.1 glycoside hydrolase family 3 C-terminal domain-containing protein [Paenibacillus agri]